MVKLYMCKFRRNLRSKMIYFACFTLVSAIGYLVSHLEYSGVRYQPGERELFYIRRQEAMLKTCEHIDINKTFMYQGETYLERQIYINSRLALCTIQKVGSVFLINLFKKTFGMETKKLSESEVDINQKNLSKIIFVRDPYTRLFSAYVDKQFSPNKAFWHIGKIAINFTRPNATERSLRCGNDPTFGEIVKYFIASVYSFNDHYTPQYSHCQPCQHKYDIIGKMETFNEDLMYIVKKFGAQRQKKLLKNELEKSHRAQVIRIKSLWLYRMRYKYRGCISFYTAQKLTWKVFQIRGIVGKTTKYKFRKAESERLRVRQFIQYVMDSYGDVADKTIARHNREEALIEGYSSVDRDDLDKLQKIFQPDCDLFGYDCRPEKIFNRSRQIIPWYFDVNTA